MKTHIYREQNQLLSNTLINNNLILKKITKLYNILIKAINLKLTLIIKNNFNKWKIKFYKIKIIFKKIKKYKVQAIYKMLKI